MKTRAANGAATVPLIEARGLHSYYGASHVLRGVDLTVMPGETVSLIGRNGMGKTTTLKTLMGLLAPRQGSITIAGADMTGAKPHAVARAGLAYVPEERGIFPNLSVRENLLMAARPGSNGRQIWTFERAIEAFPRLGERLGHWGNQLSGGEQQMLTIGRALLTNPDVLLLDEATEGLAPLIREEIWRIIRTIKASGIACLIVDKNIKQLLEVADHHVLLVKGEVRFTGTSAELAAQPELLHRHLGV